MRSFLQEYVSSISPLKWVPELNVREIFVGVWPEKYLGTACMPWNTSRFSRQTVTAPVPEKHRLTQAITGASLSTCPDADSGRSPASQPHPPGPLEGSGVEPIKSPHQNPQVRLPRWLSGLKKKKKNPPSSEGDMDAISDLGRSHLPLSNWARVPQLESSPHLRQLEKNPRSSYPTETKINKWVNK